MPRSAPQSRPAATKLRPPPLRAQRVSRPRLVALLNHGLSRSVTLVSAPAGSGKTTAVADWVRELHGRRQVAWVSLDEQSGADLASFGALLISALEVAYPGLGRASAS